MSVSDFDVIEVAGGILEVHEAAVREACINSEMGHHLAGVGVLGTTASALYLSVARQTESLGNELVRLPGKCGLLVGAATVIGGLSYVIKNSRIAKGIHISTLDS